MVGQELEVHYRYHPYFGGKVLVRCVEQRATGQFLKVQGPAGIVVSIAGWMPDPVICGAMTSGPPDQSLNLIFGSRGSPRNIFIDDLVPSRRRKTASRPGAKRKRSAFPKRSHLWIQEVFSKP
jgi:hypothetical protein